MYVVQVTPSPKNQEGIGILGIPDQIPLSSTARLTINDIGLGPSAGSFILSKLPNTTGAPVLDRLFLKDPSTPNYFSILLGREEGKLSFCPLLSLCV